jgi:beta-lactamase class A
MTHTRRFVLGGAAALGLSACVPPDQSPLGRMQATLRIIEAKAGGTLGVDIYDTATGVSVGLNRDRRFGHCSSFKLSLAAMVLALDSGGAIDGGKRVMWSADDLMHVSPFTEKRLADGASLLELAEFTQKYSDNTAANVLLRELGGPAALTAFWRSIGDTVSRLDRYEPELNNVPVTEYRDTTTPAAMSRTVAKLLYGDVLPGPSETLLKQWMIDTPTGRRRVRAGLPEGWVAGDKTGTSIWPGMDSLFVDIGFVEPPDHPPITFATYYRANETFEGMDPESEAALASVGEVIEDFAKRGEGILPF